VTRLTAPPQPFPSGPTESDAAAGRRRVAEAEGELHHLLDAGIDVLQREGITRLTLQDVLTEAGVGTRAFYRHFESKDQFLVAIWERESLRSEATLGARMRATTSSREAVTAWIDDRLELVFDPRRAARVRVFWREGPYLQHTRPSEFQRVQEPIVRLLRGAIEAGTTDGSFPDASSVLDAETIQVIFLMLAHRRAVGALVTYDQARAHLLRFTWSAFGTGRDRQPDATATTTGPEEAS